MSLRANTAFVLVATGLLTGCSKPLGTYEVQNVTLVPASAPGRIDPDQAYTGRERHLIRIEFTSTTDLEAASDGGDLYVHGDFCPFKDKYRLGALGPFYGDQPGFSSTESKNRQPPQNKNGRYVYTAYIIPSGPKGQFSEAYDLRRRGGDLCLRVDGTYFFSPPPRSNVFKIPASMVRTALLQQPPT